MAAKHDYFFLWRWLKQAVLEKGVVWFARVVWLTDQRGLFLVPHFSSQSNKI